MKNLSEINAELNLSAQDQLMIFNVLILLYDRYYDKPVYISELTDTDWFNPETFLTIFFKLAEVEPNLIQLKFNFIDNNKHFEVDNIIDILQENRFLHPETNEEVENFKNKIFNLISLTKESYALIGENLSCLQNTLNKWR